MRKSAVIIASLIAALMLTGCKVQTVQQYEAEQDKNNKVVVVADEEKDAPKVQKEDSTAEKTSDSKKVAEKPDAMDGEETAEAETKTAEKPVAATKKDMAEEKSVTSAKEPITVEKKPVVKKEAEKTVTKKETQIINNQPTIAEKKSASTGEASEKSKQTQTQTPTKNTQATTKPVTKPIVKPAKKEFVTVSIGMHILQEEANYVKLPEALQSEEYVPKSGIVASGKLEISKGATAWDAILKLAQSKKIHLDYEYKAMFSGMYIKGINHVYEKDAGPSSGWMYAVNGKLAPVGVSQYELHADDVIKLEYSVTGGSDIRW